MTDGDPATVLQRLIDGHRVSQAIHAMAALGIADRLGDDQRDCDALAVAAGCDPGALYRLLRALAAVGVLRESPERHFALTPVGAGLRRDVPGSRQSWATLAGEGSVRAAWGALADGIRTGRTPFEQIHGRDVWSFRAANPAAAALFDRAMGEGSGRAAAAIVAVGGFGRFRRIVDVGGGDGTLLAAILRAHAGVEGVLLDRPDVVARADAVLRAAGVIDRARIVGGDMLAAVPAGEAMVLKFVLHDWDDACAGTILRRCRDAIVPGGALLIVERVLAPPNEGAEGKFADLNMLVMTGGRERTQAEYAALLAASGFAPVDASPAGGALTILEARPI